MRRRENLTLHKEVTMYASEAQLKRWAAEDKKSSGGSRTGNTNVWGTVTYESAYERKPEIPVQYMGSPYIK